jgi:hypothetical protein
MSKVEYFRDLLDREGLADKYRVDRNAAGYRLHSANDRRDISPRLKPIQFGNWLDGFITGLTQVKKGLVPPLVAVQKIPFTNGISAVLCRNPHWQIIQSNHAADMMAEDIANMLNEKGFIHFVEYGRYCPKCGKPDCIGECE